MMHPGIAAPAAEKAPSARDRFLAFVVEQHPFAAIAAPAAYDEAEAATARNGKAPARAAAVLGALAKKLTPGAFPAAETTPFVPAAARFEAEIAHLEESLTGFFAREALHASLTEDEKLWMLSGIILTRACDNRMKQMFLSGELKYGALGFQGKGFRSLGQEAIFACALRLLRGPRYRTTQGWTGDVVAPLIRDLGALLAFTDDPALALAAQAGKAGPPLGGKDLHHGDLDRGVLMAAAPLSIATCTVTGMGLGMALKGERRVGVSFIGDGGSSLGEWHEAITLAAAKKLPVIYCVQNNQTALSTPVEQQTRARVFADKARGYGVPGLTVDGTDPEAIAVAFAWAADRARDGHGPTLIETVCMRMCGHAHHDDMLYLGEDPPLSFALPPVPERGYVNLERYAAWRARDPLASYAQKLIAEGLITPLDVQELQEEAQDRCDEAMEGIKARPWPPGEEAGQGVFTDGPALAHTDEALPGFGAGADDVAVEIEPAPAFDKSGDVYLAAVARGVGDVLGQDPDAFLLGEDVAAPYGNAFLLLKPLLDEYGDRILNAPIAEGAIIGALVGAALEGRRGIGEMQFNDFVASGFNQLVNNAAKFRYRTGRALPFVLRMPWGGLRRAGPYHSQDTAPWFYRSFGLKIVCPATPHDARALMIAAHQDPDPVLYYEHIGLYRRPQIKQVLDEEPAHIPLGRAAFRRLGEDLSIISYGAYVHTACAVADTLQKEDGIACDVLDLRSLCPLDEDRIAATVKRTGRVLLMGEDSKTGSILESLSSKIHESLFEHLDGPCRVLGALDTPVPYAPSLEDAFLVSESHALAVARAMLAW